MRGHEDVDSRAEANEAEAMAALDAVALGGIGDDAACDQAGDLTNQHPPVFGHDAQ